MKTHAISALVSGNWNLAQKNSANITPARVNVKLKELSIPEIEQELDVNCEAQRTDLCVSVDILSR